MDDGDGRIMDWMDEKMYGGDGRIVLQIGDGDGRWE